MKYMRRARKHETPHMRNKPQKLLRLNRSESISSVSAMQPALVNHLSWILWRSPFSDKVSIAVDMSTAKGESLGNAYINWKSLACQKQRQERYSGMHEQIAPTDYFRRQHGVSK